MKIQIQKLRSALDLLEGLAKPKVTKVETATKGKGRGGRKAKGNTTETTTWPILRNVLLKNGQAIATDLDMAVMVDMPEAVGEYLLPVKQVSSLLKSVPGTDDVEIEMKSGLVFLTWPDGAASYPVERVENFPVLPEIQPMIRHSVNADMVVPNLLSMLDYCYKVDDSKPILSGVTLFLGEQLELAAGDGYRMAFKTLLVSLPPDNGIKTVTIPIKAVATLGHLWQKAPRPRPPNGDASLISLVANKGPMEVEISPILIKIRLGIVGLLAKTIQGTPPNFKQLMQTTGEKSTLQIYGPDLERALRQLRVPTKLGLGAIRMSWEQGKMKLAIETTDGKVETSIPVNPSDGSGRVAVRFTYLQEYIQGKSGIVTMAITSSTAPVQFSHSQFPMVALMPMQVMWPDQIQAAAEAAAVAEASAITEGQPAATAEATTDPEEDKGEGEETETTEPEENAALEVTPQA